MINTSKLTLLASLLFTKDVKADIENPESQMCGDDFMTLQDIDVPVTFPEGTKSLLSKWLTPGLQKGYKGKTDATGFSFEQAIFSGCKNVDSGIGVYAGSQDSYTKFRGLFDPIIEEYHKHAPGTPHESNMDFTQLKTAPFMGQDAEMIRSTRIRVGRNLAGLPLGPGLTRE